MLHINPKLGNYTKTELVIIQKLKMLVMIKKQSDLPVQVHQSLKHKKADGHP